MSNTALNRTGVVLLTNRSGSDVSEGAAVIVDSANPDSFTTTTIAQNTNSQAGVVIEPNGIANGAQGLVAFATWIPKINLSAAAPLGAYFYLASVAGQATPHAAPLIKGDFGQVFGSGTSPKALLFGSMVSPSTGTTSGGGLTVSSIAPSGTNVTAQPNYAYFANVSPLTADRNFIVPAGTAGDVIELKVTAGDDAYELIVKGDTGITINGGATATEWSRLFITGERIRLMATSPSNWEVVMDGRIPQIGKMGMATGTSSNASGTFLTPDWDMALINQGDICDLANNRFNIRRSCIIQMVSEYGPNAAITDGKAYQMRTSVDGGSYAHAQSRSSTNSGVYRVSAHGIAICNVDSQVLYQYLTEETNKGISSDSFFGVIEILPAA